jgi:hypothetical protein
MRKMFLGMGLIMALSLASAQQIAPVDSDHDGLSDALEQALLTQFVPHFLTAPKDCSLRPAQFEPNQTTPTVEAENGTIYGQAFPRPGQADQVELHFYHLWRVDCGDMGHNLDAEHVSALVSRDQKGNWKALYWYAAAHEDTICDASQIARASALDAQHHGPTIWISSGKHGSFLSDLLCSRGCGSDECQNLVPLSVPAVINLGELSAPENGATWAGDSNWPLTVKMQRSDFTDARLARVERLPETAILWANPQKRPYQVAIHGGNGTAAGVAAGARATDSALTATDEALDLANVKTGNALVKASDRTGRGLAKTFSGVGKALRISTQKVGDALGVRSSRNQETR